MTEKTKNIVISIIIALSIVVAAGLTGLFTTIGMGGLKFDTTKGETSTPASSGTSESTGDDGDNNDDNNDGNTTPAPIDFSKLNYVGFGDSTTEGGILNNGRAETPYVEGVGIELGLKSAVNKGSGGATLADVDGDKDNCIAKFVAEVVADTTADYDIISVMGGSNDFYDWRKPIGTIDDTTIATVHGALNVIATSLKTRFPNAFIFFMTPFNNTHNVEEGYYVEGYLEDIADAVIAVANKHDIPYIDNYREGNFESEMYDTTKTDGLHPSQDFILSNIVPRVSQFIRDNYGK